MTVDLRMPGVYAMMKVDTRRGGWLMMMIRHIGRGGVEWSGVEWRGEERRGEESVGCIGEGGREYF